jgi:hypothetical protein
LRAEGRACPRWNSSQRCRSRGDKRKFSHVSSPSAVPQRQRFVVRLVPLNQRHRPSAEFGWEQLGTQIRARATWNPDLTGTFFLGSDFRQQPCHLASRITR